MHAANRCARQGLEVSHLGSLLEALLAYGHLLLAIGSGRPILRENINIVVTKKTVPMAFSHTESAW
jgi:hypothetical protein